MLLLRPAFRACTAQVGPSAGRGPKQKGSCSPDLSGDEEDTWAARLLKPLPVSMWTGCHQLTQLCLALHLVSRQCELFMGLLQLPPGGCPCA